MHIFYDSFPPYLVGPIIIINSKSCLYLSPDATMIAEGCQQSLVHFQQHTESVFQRGVEHKVVCSWDATPATHKLNSLNVHLFLPAAWAAWSHWKVAWKEVIWVCWPWLKDTQQHGSVVPYFNPDWNVSITLKMVCGWWWCVATNN